MNEQLIRATFCTLVILMLSMSLLGEHQQDSTFFEYTKNPDTASEGKIGSTPPGKNPFTQEDTGTSHYPADVYNGKGTPWETQEPTEPIYPDVLDLMIFYEKIESSLLYSLKSQETVKVVVTSTDMHAVRELLGHKTLKDGGRMEFTGRLQTSIFEIPSHMVLKIASLPSVVAIEGYKLMQPPIYPEQFTPLQGDQEDEPAMWNAVKYHWADNAWNLGFNGTGINVAVMDTGVDFGHPDLNGTQARDENPSSPYFGWPLAFDSRSMNSYLSSGGLGFTGSGGEDNWFSDTSATYVDGNSDGLLDGLGYNVTGITSQSGVYHFGRHPDTQLRNLYGNYVGVLVVDEVNPGEYDTVYVDLDDDDNFTDEKPCRKGDETPVLDLGTDGVPDRSGGMIYFIADGINPVPYSDIIAEENGYSLPVPGQGDLVCFMINDPTESGGNHGTLCASAIAGQGVIASGRVKGTAPNAKIISIGNIYQGGNDIDSYYFAVEGYDGIPGTGDEAQIVSCSYGDSDVINSGWDFTSRFVDNLTAFYAPNVTFSVASGNGGYGYGTVVSPGSSMGVVTVGAALNRRDTEVVYWSNRGPNSVGQLDPDVVSVGVSAFGDQAVNQKSDGTTAYQSWSGTSLATPVTAGIIALVYQAYSDTHGGFPTSGLAREILMSTADNLNYDPLVQGAGFCNATRAILVASNTSGLLLSPSFWTAGNYRGIDYEAFAHILHPGESDNITVSVSNQNKTGPMDVQISDYILTRTETHTVAIESNKSLLDGSGNRPDYLIALNDSINGISYIPNDTALLKVWGFMPYDEFDKDMNYNQENRFTIAIYNWKDTNGNGSYWNDSNSDGVSQSAEIEWGELTEMSSSGITATTQEARVHDPLTRMDDGIIVGVFHLSTGPAVNFTHIYVQSQCYNRTDWEWLFTNTTTLSIAGDGKETFEAQLSIPLDTPIGIYEGMIVLNETKNETAMPVIVNVASDSDRFTFGGNTPSSDLYSNDQVFGAFRWGWRYEGGDWRFYFTDIPDSYQVKPGTKLIADVEWENYPTDIDVFILGSNEDKFSKQEPGRFGPYTLDINGRSVDSYMWSGKFRFNTTSGTTHEVVAADLGPGLNEIILHNVLYSGHWFSENATGMLGIVNATPYPWDLGFIDNPANLSANKEFTLLSSFNLSGITASAYGVFPSMEYYNELIYQNPPSDKTTANWSREFNVSGAQYLKINISSQYSLDLDLYLLRDINLNGLPDWSSEQVASSTSPGDEEEILLNSPANGRYWAFVHGWSVPAGSSLFDCSIEVVYGNDIRLSDVPTGNITENVPVYFNASVSIPPLGGKKSGVIIIGLSDIYDTIKIPFLAELESEKPAIWNTLPSPGSLLNISLPTISAQYNDSGSGINQSCVFIYIDGFNYTSAASVTSEGITLVPPSPLSEGYHTIYLVVYDYFANSNSTSWEIFVDTKVPEISSVQPQPNEWLNYSSPTVIVNYNDSGIGVDLSATFLYIDGINETQNSTVLAGSITHVPVLPRSEGAHTVVLIVADLLGNKNSTTWQFFTDSIAPISNPGTDINVLEDELVIFDGSLSFDVNGIFNYSWTFGDGGIGYGINPTHVYPQAGMYVVGLSVWDKVNHTGYNTKLVYVNNVAPVAVAGSDQSINEGDTAYFDGSASYDTPSDMSGLIFTWYFHDGLVKTGISVNHTYPDNGVFNVLLVVTDNNGYTDSDNLTVTVNNVAPFVDALGPYLGYEGEEIAFSCIVSDPGYDTFTYEWDFDDSDGISYSDASGPSPIWMWTDDFSGTIYLRVTDDDKGVGFDTASVTVNNLAPIAEIGGPYIGLEGGVIALFGSFSDPGADTVSYQWDFDFDGFYDDASIQDPQWTWFDNGVYMIGLRVVDDDGGFDIKNTTVFVSNVAPLANANGPYSQDEGNAVNFTGSASDPGINDTLYYLWDFGDGSTSALQNPQHVFKDNGVYVISFTVTDDDGGTHTNTTSATIFNVAPTAYAGGPYYGDEGMELSFTGSGDDPGTDDVLSYFWEFGDGYNSSLKNPKHTYADDGVFTLTLTVTDDDGGIGTNSTEVAISNVNPSGDCGGPYFGDEGKDLFFIGSAYDPGVDDVLSYFWEFGDGYNSSLKNPKHTYADNGVFTLTLTVTDDDGGIGTDSKTVTISNVNPSGDCGGPYYGNEGMPVQFSASASDPGDDILTYSWDFDDSDGLSYGDATGPIPTWTWFDDFLGTVFLKIEDDDGGLNFTKASVTIYNAPPVADSGGPYVGVEGTLLSLSGNHSEAGADSVTYEWDFDDDGEYDDAVGQNPKWTWNDNGYFIIGLKVTDDEGGFDIDKTTVAITNVAPTANAGGPYTGFEGSVISFFANASDPSPEDTFTFTWDFGDGTLSTLQNPTHVYSDDGIYLVTLTVMDDDGAVHTDSVNVTVYNVGPQAFIGGPYSGYEGQEVSFSGSAYDPGDDILTYAWDIDNDGSYDDAFGQDVKWTWNDEGVYMIGLQVTDDNGSSATDSTSVTIYNSAPKASAEGPYSQNEGYAVTLTGSAQDAGADTFSFDWDLDDDGLYDDAAGEIVNWTWNDNGVFVIGLRVTDDDGGIGFASTTVSIGNVAPSVFAGGPYSQSENTPLEFNGTWFDPGEDSFTYFWDFGDGASSTAQNPNHTYSDDGTYIVTFMVTDDDGGVGTNKTVAIINNLAPIFEKKEYGVTANEGTLFIFTINATDAPGDTITFSDNSELFTIDPKSGTILFTPTNDDVGSHQVTIRAEDDDGDFSMATLTINILNVNNPPVLDPVGNLFAQEEVQFIYSVIAGDIDSNDSLIFSDDSELFEIDAETGIISFKPTNDDVGLYQIKITVTDRFGASDSEVVSLTILNTNDAPVLSDIQPQNAKVGERFVLSLSAVDVDDGILIYSDDSDLFVIDPVSGTISFVPQKGDEGLHIITITVTDSSGESDTKTLSLDIKGVPEPKKGIDWVPYILLILIVVLFTLFILHLLAERKKKEGEDAKIDSEGEGISSDVMDEGTATDTVHEGLSSDSGDEGINFKTEGEEFKPDFIPETSQGEDEH